MISVSKEDYLKVIYQLSEEGALSNKDIAAALNVAPASVSEMLKKLSAEKYLKYEPYKGVTLTEKGRERAAELTLKHRVWEVFLVEKLGYDWAEVHTMAERLEHAADLELAKRLWAYLDYPQSCPHGWPIPKKGAGRKRVPRPLSEFEENDEVEIIRVKESEDFLKYLSGAGLKVGKTYTISKKEAFLGEVILTSKAGDVRLSDLAAAQVYAERKATK